MYTDQEIKTIKTNTATQSKKKEVAVSAFYNSRYNYEKFLSYFESTAFRKNVTAVDKILATVIVSRGKSYRNFRQMNGQPFMAIKVINPIWSSDIKTRNKAKMQLAKLGVQVVKSETTDSYIFRVF